MARTFRFMAAVSQPSPPLCECVTRTADRSCRTTLRLRRAITFASNGPVSGVIGRKYWFSASGSRENCTPGKRSGQMPTRKMLNQVWSSGVAADRSRQRCCVRHRRAGLVDQVHAEAAAQEDVLEALASVRRGLPGLRELAEAVPEHERKFAGVRRDLIERVGVIAVQRLVRPARAPRFHRRRSCLARGSPARLYRGRRTGGNQDGRRDDDECLSRLTAASSAISLSSVIG